MNRDIIESIIAFIVVLAIKTTLVYFCWNAINEQVFLTPYELTYFQSVLLVMLSNVLFDNETVTVKS